MKKGPGRTPGLSRFGRVAGYLRFAVRLRTVRRVARFAGAAFFFVALRRRLAGAFFAAFFVALRRRFFAGAAFFAALRRFFAGAFFAALRFVAFFAVDFRFAVVFRFAGALRVALRFLAGARFAARFLVAFFAGGTVTTFLRRALTRGSFETSGNSVRAGVQPRALLGQEPCTWALNFEPTENFALLRSGICTG